MVSTTRVAERATSSSTRRTEPTPGDSTLLIKARSLVADRQWEPALTVLHKARSLDGDSPELLGLLAIAASHRRKRRLRDESLAKLTETRPDAVAWTAIAASHLATNDFADADRAARQAIDRDGTHAPAWGALAAAFAGLGWFEETNRCLRSGERHGELDGFGRWQLGRAINGWALSRNHAPLVALIGTILLGNLWLGLAVAFTVPLIAREFRVGLLDSELKEIAETQWFEEKRMRLGYSAAVLCSLSVWIVLLQFG